MAVLKSVVCVLPLVIVGICVYNIMYGMSFGVGDMIGIKGSQGVPGSKGANGSKGDTGATGPKGEPGVTGKKGEDGQKGVTGGKGEKGEDGEPGHLGPKGGKGDKGDTGAKGEAGMSHPYMIIHGTNGQLKCKDDKPPEMTGYSHFVRTNSKEDIMNEPDLLTSEFSCVDSEAWEEDQEKKNCARGECEYVNYWLGKKEKPFKCARCDTKTTPYYIKHEQANKKFDCGDGFEPLWKGYGYRFSNYKFDDEDSSHTIDVCLEASNPETYCNQHQRCKTLELTKDNVRRCRVCVRK
uniref:Collagen alpha-3(VI) chain n=1 Tax=Cacopsylla melanoneura TaxID=428564 RepID=A0A8D8QRW6_9HEMI